MLNHFLRCSDLVDRCRRLFDKSFKHLMILLARELNEMKRLLASHSTTKLEKHFQGT